MPTLETLLVFFPWSVRVEAGQAAMQGLGGTSPSRTGLGLAGKIFEEAWGGKQRDRGIGKEGKL